MAPKGVVVCFVGVGMFFFNYYCGLGREVSTGGRELLCRYGWDLV